MKSFLVSLLALGAMSSFAFADTGEPANNTAPAQVVKAVQVKKPVKMTDAKMDTITAGSSTQITTRLHAGGPNAQCFNAFNVILECAAGR